MFLAGKCNCNHLPFTFALFVSVHNKREPIKAEIKRVFHMASNISVHFCIYVICVLQRAPLYHNTALWADFLAPCIAHVILPPSHVISAGPHVGKMS